MTNYPTSLDTATELPSPTKYDHIDTSGLEHHLLETNQSTALLALEAKTGITNSAVTTSHDYRIRQLEGAVGTPLTPTGGSGSPEGVVTGGLGRTYVDNSVDPPNVWVKTTASGNTGWRQIIG